VAADDTQAIVNAVCQTPKELIEKTKKLVE